ncbi:ABC transporter G family member 23-like [Brevipalpus obovatus]|uniref:ABC transporter G family member 23-like n=1 Tax=Brevipalpus obovatus TaxID=246614 RepID=UPI003D9EA3E2
MYSLQPSRTTEIDRGKCEQKFIARLKDVNVELGNRTTILKDVNFTLIDRSIIGVIGPSGCGKTTLLRALVGIIPIKSGLIELAGHDIRDHVPRSMIGYMPQDVGLVGLWKGSEMFTFFGRVYGLDDEVLKTRIKELQDEIDLPSDLGLISGMSGGQQRRLSLALTLIHRPKLLLLDEPTVGSDPVSRVKIWKYLEKCRDQFGSTVVVTTHYIDEVRKADTVAFMYYGQLLRHELPEKIVQQYKAKDLEEATQAMCRQYLEFKTSSPLQRLEKEKKCSQDLFKDPFSNSVSIPRVSKKTRSGWDLTIASTIRLMTEWRFHLSAAIFFDLQHTLFTYMILQFLWRAPQNLPLCIVNENFGNNDTSIFDSALLIRKLNDTSLLSPIDCSEEEAILKTRSGKVIGYVSIDSSYESKMFRRTYDTEESASPLMYFYGDYANVVKSFYTERFLNMKLLDEIKSSKKIHNRSDHYLDFVRIESINEESLDIGDSRHLINYFTSMILIYLCYQGSQGGASFSVIADKMNGFHERQRFMGIKPLHLFVSHYLRNMLFITPWNIIFSYILILSVGIEVNHLVYKFFFILFAMNSTGICFGLLMGCLFESPLANLGALFGYNLSILWVNGAIWPIESLPYFMKLLEYLYPYKESARAGYSLISGNDADLWGDPLRTPLIWMIVTSFVAIKIMK